MGGVAGIRGRFGARTLATAGGVLGLGIAAGVVGALALDDPHTWLAVALLVLTPAPIVVRLLQRRFDPFEPIQIISLTLFIMFGVRPAAELIYGIHSFYNMETRTGFTGAAVICLLGTAGLYAGYASDAGRRLA